MKSTLKKLNVLHITAYPIKTICFKRAQANIEKRLAKI